MATRYWVPGSTGGAGYWTYTSHWSTASGGAGGASVPGADDDVIFDENSITADSVTINAYSGDNGCHVKSLNFTGVTHNPTLVLDSYLGIINIHGGNITLDSGMTLDSNVKFYIISGSCTLTSAGTTINTVNAASGCTLDLADDLTLFYLYIAGATLNTNNHDITCGYNCTISGSSPVVTLGSSTITCAGFGVSTSSVTLDAGTSKIITERLYLGDADTVFTLYDVQITGGSSCGITYSGALYCHDFKIADCDEFTVDRSNPSLACQINCSGDFSTDGSLGNVIEVSPTFSTWYWYVIKSSGSVSISYTRLKGCIASGGAVFYAPLDDGNIDGGGNTGWTFTPVGEKVIVGSISAASNFVSNIEDIGLPITVDEAIDGLMEAIPEEMTVSDAFLVAHWSDGGGEEHGDVSETISDGLMMFDSSIPAWVKIIEEALTLDDSLAQSLGIAISDWLTLVDTQTNNWNGKEIFTDTLNLYDIASFGKVISDTLTESLVITDVATYKLVVGILEHLGFTDLATALKTMAESSTDSLALTDGAERGFNFTINEALAAVDTVSVVATFLRSLSDSIAIAETLSNINRIYGTISEALSFAEVVTVKGTLYTAVYDTIAMNVLVELADDIYECYVLNTPKFLPSMYSGFNFNSYCVFENRAFAANDDGIYELTGETDAGDTIHTGVVMSQTDFGAPNQKKFRRGYLGISGTSPVMILETEDGGRQVYTIDTNGKTVFSHEQKSKKWKLYVSDFSELDSIKLIPVVLSK